MRPDVPPAHHVGGKATWVIDGVEMTVEKKKIKNMYIRIDASGGPVRITAPCGVSDDSIYRFASRRTDWIRKKQTALVNKLRAGYEEGSIHELWGRPFPLSLRVQPGLAAKDACCSVSANSILMEVPEAAGDSLRAALLDELYRKEMNAAVPAALERASRITGRKANAWTVRKMTSRWGSCNTAKATISLNLLLARKPVSCLEYVAVHELTHLLEKGHGPRFWGYIDAFCPEWKSIRKILNENRSRI